MPDSAPLCGVFGRGLWGASHLHNGVKCLEGKGLGAGVLYVQRLGRLTTDFNQEWRLHTSFPQEELSGDPFEFLDNTLNTTFW